MLAYIDALIPGVLGLLLMMLPQRAFITAGESGADKQIKWVRKIGALLLVAAGLIALAQLFGS